VGAEENGDAEDSDIDIVVNGPWLEQDFVAFEPEEGEDEEDGERNIDHEFLPGGWEEMEGSMIKKVGKYEKMKKMKMKMHSGNCMKINTEYSM
jgi:hypothetical protein